MDKEVEVSIQTGVLVGVDAGALSILRCLYLMHTNGKFTDYETFSSMAMEIHEYMKMQGVMSVQDRYEITKQMREAMQYPKERAVENTDGD